jgi:hypothetical protein
MTKLFVFFLVFLLGNTGLLADEPQSSSPNIPGSTENAQTNLPLSLNKSRESQKLQLCLQISAEQRPTGETNSGREPSSPKSPKAGRTSKPDHLEKIVQKYAQQHAVEEKLVWAVMRKESGYNPDAVSPKGAMGLMQLMPGTASMLGVAEPFDPEQNIAGGVKYLKLCLNQFGQDVGLALAAYNAGPGNVVKYQGCPPFAETRAYVDSVMSLYSGQPLKGKRNYIKARPVVVSEVSAEPIDSGYKWKALPPLVNLPLMEYKVSTPTVRDKNLLNKVKQELHRSRLEQARYAEPTNPKIFQQ